LHSTKKYPEEGEEVISGEAKPEAKASPEKSPK
jgi:hypothetical protein